MPIVVRHGFKPKVVSFEYITKMSMAELVAYEKYLWACMDKIPNSPVIQTRLNAVHREVEWRAQDTEGH